MSPARELVRTCPRGALLLALALIPRAANGQGCCTPGTSPLGGLTGPPMVPGSVAVGLAFDGYHLRHAYKGADRIQDPGGRHSQVARTLAYLRVGLPWDAVLVADLPYDYRMREQRFMVGSSVTEVRLSNRALGDLSTTLLIRVLPRSRPASWGVNLGAGVKWATGSVERGQDGLRLPVELQTGTGSNDPLLALTAHRAWARGGALVSSIARFPREGNNGYRYGTEAHAVALGFLGVGPFFTPGAEFRLRVAERDRFQQRELVNTGGWRLMAGPRLLLSWREARIGIEGALLWPLAQHLNGLQLGVDRQVLLGMRWPE